MKRTGRIDDDFADIAAHIGACLHAAVESQPTMAVQGGCINDSYRWDSSRGPLFVKLAAANRLPMFQAEAAGLEELSRAAAVRVPRVHTVGIVEDVAYLALEWIDLTAANPATETALGVQLAYQHRDTTTDFGWHRDNTIGSTPQINTRSSEWIEFFREHRLRFQLDLAQRNGYTGRLQRRGEQLLIKLPGLFDGYQPAPSLLHGDLWGGNRAADATGAPVIFDPAVYYGDREADIAMTRLFGGFSSAFYDAYQNAWPLDPGAATRTTLYNLYHILNHLNLFGASYRQQAESMIDRLLAELA